MFLNRTYIHVHALAKQLISSILMVALLCFNTPFSWANLQIPAWYDLNAVNLAPDWHYRVPINVPAGATINSTIKVDVDFSAQLAALGVSGTLDVNSPRVVRSTGAISTIQEFTDTVFAGVTDAANNNRGEVRFILQDAGAVTYYLYFDITANGAKPANPQLPINGNFEKGAAGTPTPLGWNAPVKTVASHDAQMRPTEIVSVVTNPPPVAGLNPRNTDGSPFTGSFSYLLGDRTGAAVGAGTITFTKNITIPAATPGNISVRWRPEGWDSTGFDTLSIQIVGATTVNVVGPPANLAAYAITPNSPNFGNAQATATAPGYRQYNGYDCGTNGVHTAVPPMTVVCGTDNWFTKTMSLAAFAGQAVTLRITYSGDAADRTWFSIDDFEWSVVTATLGTPQAFGVNVTLPTAASSFVAGQTISIIAQVDAQPTAAGTPVTADIFDNAGNLVVSALILYNDGTHGDAAANNNIWTNTAAYVVPAGFVSGNNWFVRVYARDASISTIGATAGLIHIPTLPNTPFSQANFYNVDDQFFIVNTPLLSNLKTVATLSDPINNVTNPKNIPDATVQYTIRITNSGTGTVDNNTLVITDPIPANTTFFSGGVSGGAPYIFTNGVPSSNLSCPFIALANLTDCVDFSNNGGTTWAYVPNGAYDVAVTHVRFKLTGAMSANTGAGAGAGGPFFELKFNVQVK
ncbi:MAG: hypothetical protein HOP06_02670 [Methylotenera sp.]|nr:hypothetical protein [Methylotenera sp.]